MATVVTPPMLVRLRYRLLGLRVPARWLAWVERDVSSPYWWIRTRLLAPVPLLIVILSTSISSPSLRMLWPLVGAAGGVFLAVLLTRLGPWRHMMEVDRREFLAYQRGERGYPWFGRWEMSRRGMLAATAIGLAASIVIIVIVWTFFT